VIARAPRQLPDVFAGAPLVCALELSPDGGEITVRGTVAHGEWTQRVRVPSAREASESGAIVTLFGREHVADLETEWSTGEGQRHIDAQIEAAGLRFQIATRLTSWVAVDSHVGVDPYAPSRTEIVPQELPYGTTMQSFGMLHAATTGAGVVRPEMLGFIAQAPMALAAPAAPPAMRARPAAGMPPRVRAPEPPEMLAKPRSAPAFGEEEEADEPTLARSTRVAGPGATGGRPPPSEPSAPHQQQMPRPMSESRPSNVEPSPAVFDTPLSPAPKKRPRTWLIALVVLLVFLLIAAAWFLLR